MLAGGSDAQCSTALDSRTQKSKRRHLMRLARARGEARGRGQLGEAVTPVREGVRD